MAYPSNMPTTIYPKKGATGEFTTDEKLADGYVAPVTEVHPTLGGVTLTGATGGEVMATAAGTTGTPG